jgi:Ca2+-binding EF-hand superfamily protein
MLGCTSQINLKNLLDTTGRGERDLERLRQNICRIYDFTPAAAWYRLDRTGRGYVNASDLLDFLRDNANYRATFSECDALVKFYDSDKDGVLSLADFQQMILSCEDNYLRDSAMTRCVRKCCTLPSDQEYALLQLVERELDLQRNIDSQKRVLGYGCDYTAVAAFDSIDTCRSGRIHLGNLRCFLERNGYYALESDCVPMIRRIDTDGDLEITFSEWCAFMQMDVTPRPSTASQRSPRHSSSSPSKPLRDPSPTKQVSTTVECEPVRPVSPVRRCYSPIRYYPPYYPYCDDYYYYYGSPYYYPYYPYYRRYWWY